MVTNDPNDDLSGAIKGAGEIAKLGSKVYEDLAAPLARPIGKTAGALAESILTGPTEVFLTLTQIQSWLGGYVRQTLDRKGISAQRVQPPEPQVYLGVVSGMVSSGHVSELREMFGNLLVNAMDTEAGGLVHPSFAEIVRQLSPGEARLIKHLREEGYVPTISIKARHDILGGDHDIADHFTLVADQLAIRLALLGTYFQNLERLGLVKQWVGREIIASDAEYESIVADDRVVQLLSVDRTWRRAYAVRGFVEITSFGTMFGTVCLNYDGPCPMPALSKEQRQD